MVGLNGSTANGSSMNGSGMNGNSVNGSVHGHEPTTTVAAPSTDDAASVEFARLQTELVSAKERLESARTRLTGRDRALQEALRTELAEAQEMLAQLDRTHQATIAKIHADTQAEVDRILSEARAASAADPDEAPNVR